MDENNIPFAHDGFKRNEALEGLAKAVGGLRRVDTDYYKVKNGGWKQHERKTELGREIKHRHKRACGTCAVKNCSLRFNSNYSNQMLARMLEIREDRTRFSNRVMSMDKDGNYRNSTVACKNLIGKPGITSEMRSEVKDSTHRSNAEFKGVMPVRRREDDYLEKTVVSSAGYGVEDEQIDIDSWDVYRNEETRREEAQADWEEVRKDNVNKCQTEDVQIVMDFGK